MALLLMAMQEELDAGKISLMAAVSEEPRPSFDRPDTRLAAKWARLAIDLITANQIGPGAAFPGAALPDWSEKIREFSGMVACFLALESSTTTS